MRFEEGNSTEFLEYIFEVIALSGKKYIDFW